MSVMGLDLSMRIGIGYDVHALVADRPLVIGGVTIPYEKGLEGHSDADVLVHAVSDATFHVQMSGFKCRGRVSATISGIVQS